MEIKNIINNILLSLNFCYLLLFLLTILSLIGQYWKPLILGTFFKSIILVDSLYLFYYIKKINPINPNKTRLAKIIMIFFWIVFTSLVIQNILNKTEIVLYSNTAFLFIVSGVMILYFNNREIIYSEENKKIKNNKNYYFLILIGMMMIGFFIRIKNISLPSFWSDEILLVESAKSALTNGIPTLPSGEPYLVSILSTAVLGIIYLFLPINEFYSRLPFVIFGTLLIPTVYILVNRVKKDRFIAMASSLGIASSLWLINYSREIRMYALHLVLVILFFIFFFKFIESKKDKYLWFLLLISVLGILNFIQFLLILPIFFIYYIIDIKLKGEMVYKKILSDRKLIVIITFFFLLSIVEWKTISYFLFNPVIYSYFGTGIFYYINLYSSEFPYLWLLSILWLIYLLLFKIKESKKSLFGDIIMVIIPAVLFVIISITFSTKLERYSIFLFPFFVINSIVCLNYLLKFSIKNEIIYKLLIIVFVLFLLTPIQEGYEVGNNKVSYNPILQKNKYSWREGVEYLNEVNKEKLIVISTDSLLTSYYGVEADFSILTLNSKINKEGNDDYSGKKFIDNASLNSFKGYLITDINKIRIAEIKEFISDKNTKLIYDKEGIRIYKKD